MGIGLPLYTVWKALLWAGIMTGVAPIRARFAGLSLGGGLGLEVELVEEDVGVARGSGVLGFGCDWDEYPVWDGDREYPGGDWPKPGTWGQFSLRAATAGTQALCGRGGMLWTMD